MKIIFIAQKYDYGNPELGLSYEYRNLYETLIRMNQGNNQIMFLASDVINREAPGTLNQKLLKAIYQQKPDLVIFVSSELDKEISKEVIMSKHKSNLLDTRINKKLKEIKSNLFANREERTKNNISEVAISKKSIKKWSLTLIGKAKFNQVINY